MLVAFTWRTIEAQFILSNAWNQITALWQDTGWTNSAAFILRILHSH